MNKIRFVNIEEINWIEYTSTDEVSIDLNGDKGSFNINKMIGVIYSNKQAIKLHSKDTKENLTKYLADNFGIKSKEIAIEREELILKPFDNKCKLYLIKERKLITEVISLIEDKLFYVNRKGYPFIGWNNILEDLELRSIDPKATTYSKITPKGHKKAFSIFDINDTSNLTVIVEGLISGLSYLQLTEITNCRLIVLNSISNVNQLLEKHHEYLTGKIITLALDSDSPGINSNLELKEKLSKIIKNNIQLAYPNEFKSDWNDELKNLGINNKDKVKRTDLKNIKEIFSSLKPSDKLVVPWSAGSGKTTSIVKLLIENFSEGFVYSCNTIDEIKLMYSKLCDLNIKIALYYEGSPDYDKLRNNIYLFQEYHIILITHSSLYLLPPSCYSTLTKPVSEIDPSSVIRKAIIIDEKDIKYNSREISDASLSLYKMLTENTSLTLGGYNKIQNISFNNYIKYLNKAKIDDFNNYQSLINNKITKNAFENLSGVKWNISFTEDHARVRLSFLYLELLRLYTPNPVDGFDNLELLWSLSELKIPIINFDGTGDLTCYNSNIWKVIDNDFPYNFTGNIIPSDITPRERSIAAELGINKELTYTNKYHQTIKYVEIPYKKISSKEVNKNIEDFITDIVNEIKVLLTFNKKLFIVIWKDLKGEVETHSIQNDDEEESHIIEVIKSKVNLPEIIGDKLLEFDINENRFSITYWQSGKTRATNEFKDCDSVLLVGNFFLPINEINKYNKATSSKNTKITLFASEIIQAIYRTRIRDGYPVNVYYTKDMWETMGFVSNYLKFNQSDCYISYMINLLFKKDLLEKRLLKYLNIIIENYYYELSDFLRYKKSFKINLSELSKKLGKDRTDNLGASIKNLLDFCEIKYENEIIGGRQDQKSYIKIIYTK